MSTYVLSCKAYGPYENIRTRSEIRNLAEFINEFRVLFEDRVDAIAIVKDGVTTALMTAEPDVDCDQDGFYEVAPQYPGQEYIRYDKEHRSFDQKLSHYFAGIHMALTSP